MFDTVNGLPLHPLVVHGVVVLLPLSVLGAFALVLGLPGAGRTGRCWWGSPPWPAC